MIKNGVFKPRFLYTLVTQSVDFAPLRGEQTRLGSSELDPRRGQFTENGRQAASQGLHYEKYMLRLNQKERGFLTMARVDSYTKKDVKKILNEHDRTAKKYKNWVDRKRSNLNWSYGLGNKNSEEVLQAIEDRCDTIMDGKKMQEHTNVMSEWVVTYPATSCTEEKCTMEKENDEGEIVSAKRTYNKPNDMEHCRKFFDTVYQFACDRYGAENVIAGYVHMDETTPHISINLVPEAVSRKNGKRTVSSASLFTKTELKRFQQDLEKEMQKVFNQKNMILNGRTKGNFTIEELKARQESAKVWNGKKEALNKKIAEVNARKNELDEFEGGLQAREDDLAQRESEFQASMKKRQETANKRDTELDKRENVLDENIETYNQKVENYNTALQKLRERQEEFETEKREYKQKVRKEYEKKFHEHIRTITQEFRQAGIRVPSNLLQAETEYKKDNDELSL